MTEPVVFGVALTLFSLIMLGGARETLLDRQSAKAAAARLRERRAGRIPYRSWDVGAASGLRYRIFILDRDDHLWHQARRLYPGCAHVYCQRRIGVERTLAFCNAHSWSELKWRQRSERTGYCADCAKAFRADRAEPRDVPDLDRP